MARRINLLKNALNSYRYNLSRSNPNYALASRIGSDICSAFPSEGERKQTHGLLFRMYNYSGKTPISDESVGKTIRRIRESAIPKDSKPVPASCKSGSIH